MDLEQAKVKLMERIEHLKKRMSTLPPDAKRTLLLQLKADLNFAKKRFEAIEKRISMGGRE